MRVIGLLFAALLLAGCSLLHKPPSAADQHFTVVIYNRTQAPVFLLDHEVAACGSARMPVAETLVAAGTAPPGVVTVGPVTIKTPRGYGGIVSLVVTDAGTPTETLGDIPEGSLPPCQAGMAPACAPPEVAVDGAPADQTWVAKARSRARQPSICAAPRFRTWSS